MTVKEQLADILATIDALTKAAMDILQSLGEVRDAVTDIQNGDVQ